MPDPTNPMPAGKPGLGGQTAAPGRGNLRPDAEPADTESRDINPFKQAFNVFMFGSRDPSHADVGEMRAGHIQKKYIYDALLAAPPGDPARAQVVATMGAMGAQAAQSMRERYYAKEYKQMVSTQIVPLKAQIEEFQAEARDRLAMSNQAVPRHLGVEEGAAIRNAEQAATVAPPEIVSKGKTADGKDKGQTQVQGTAVPGPNSALETPGQVAGTIFDPETPSYLDPVTGVPVPIASHRGQQIHEEVMSEFTGKQNEVMLKMMDVLASYGGNPYASESLQKMIESTASMAGSAVTGRTDPQTQTEWWDKHQKAQADIEGVEADTEKKSLDLQQAASDIRAQAADALDMAARDPAFNDMLGKRLQKLIASGKGVDEMTSKQIQDLAAMSSMHRDLQKEDLRKQAEAGMIAIPPVRLGEPTTWLDWMNTNDERYIAAEQEKFAELTTGLEGKLNAIQSLPSEQKEKFFKEYAVPSDVRLFIREGHTSEKPVVDWINRFVQGSEQFKDAKGEAYMERLEHGMVEQQGLEDAILAQNEDYLAAYIAKYPNTPPETMEYMRVDVLGTHYRYAQGREATEWRPPQQAKAIRDYRAEREEIASGRAAQMQAAAATQVAQAPPEELGPQMSATETDQLLRDVQARPATGDRPSTGDYLQRMDVATIPDAEITGNTSPQAMSQTQLGDQIDRLHNMLMEPEVMSNPQLQRKIHMRMSELREHHEGLGERMLLGTIGAIQKQFSNDPEEIAEAAEQARIREKDVLRFVPGQKVN